MANTNIGFAGAVAIITADVTFGGTPFAITYFPDDTDPFALDDIEIADMAMGANGNTVSWAKAAVQPFSLAVIAGSEDYINLKALLDANTVTENQTPNNDSITISRVMPNGTKMEISGAVITGGSSAMSFTSDGRVKTPVFMFKGPPAKEVVA